MNSGRYTQHVWHVVYGDRVQVSHVMIWSHIVYMRRVIILKA